MLVASSLLDEQMRYFEKLFGCLKDYGVIVNRSRCVFGQSEVKFLGYLVSSNNTQPLHDKIKANNGKAVKQFLGAVCF